MAVAVGFLIFLAALLYSSVGHAGASGYLAVMALCGMSAAEMKPTALVLNILVATIATARFARAGCFRGAFFWPFAAGSVPFAALGGAINLPGAIFRPAVGTILLLAAALLYRGASTLTTEGPDRPVRWPLAVAIGAIIGLLSGLTATGGGIFLTPLLLLTGWAGPRTAAGASAAFNLVNSIAGLAGQLSGLANLPDALPWWAAAAGIGGIIGSECGSRRLGNSAIRKVLATVLIIAGLKLILVR